MASHTDEDRLMDVVDEFIDRTQRGESPDIEDYCRQYPDLSAELRELLGTLFVLDDLAPVSEDGVSPQPSDLPEQIGDYRIIGEIGRGGMGVVYEAEQESLGRRVALKVLPPGQFNSEGAQLRFNREARAAARMHHTNIVPVFEVGQDGSHFFYAMQLIDGHGLDQIIDELRLSQDKEADHPLPLVDQSGVAADSVGSESHSQSAVSASLQSTHGTTGNSTHAHLYRTVSRLAAEVADALAFAHGRGVIHRDIKPSNLMLDMHGVTWVTDFGLAKTVEDDATLTKSGDYLGTLRYMSPERFRGQCDERADIYALGLTLYELLLLTPAFEAADRIKLIYLINNTEATRPRSIDPRIPRDLETIILKCIEKDPARRYPSASELAEDLQRFVNDEPIRARRASIYERTVRWTRRNKGLASALGGIATLLILIAAGSVVFSFYQTRLLRSAELNEQRAQSALIAADAARQETDDTLIVLQTKSDELERSLYASEINLAGRGLGKSGSIQRLREVTERWSPALAQSGNDLRGWEWYFLQSVALEQVVTLPPREFTDATFNADDTLVAVLDHVGGTPQEDIDIFDSRTGQYVRTLTGHKAGVKGLAWSGATNMIASSSFDKTIRLWDGATGECLRTIERPDNFPGALAWDASGNRLAALEPNVAQKPCLITIFDLTAKDLAPTSFDTGGKRYDFLSFSPGGQRLIAIAGNLLFKGIKVWDTESGEVVEEMPNVDSVVWGIDQESVASHFACRPSGEIDLIGADHRTVKRTYRGLSRQATRPFLSRDGTKVISGSTDNTVRVWDYESTDLLRTFQRHRADVVAVREDNQGKRILSSGLSTHIWNSETDHRSILKTPHPAKISWHPESQRLAVASWDQVRVLDLHRSEFVAVGSEAATMCQWSPDGSLLATNRLHKRSGRSTSTLQILNGAPATKTVDYPATGTVQDISWHPTKRRCLYSGNYDIHLLDIDTGELLSDVEKWNDARTAFWTSAWNHAQPNLIAYSHGNAIRVWDLQTKKHLATFNGHEHRPREVRWSPDGTRLASASSDFSARIWSLETGSELFQLVGHNNQVLGISWDPDGQRLATAGSDGSVRIWDAIDGSELLRLDDHQCEVLSVAWSPDGRKIASGSIDSKLIVWDASAAYAAEQTAQKLAAHSASKSDASTSNDEFFVSEIGSKLRSPDWTWTTPEPAGSTVNSPGDDYEPCLATDELTIIFHSDRPDGSGGNDLWMATRESTNAEWQSATNLGPTINSSGNDESPALSADGLMLYFASDRDGGSRNIWMASRESMSGKWTSPIQIPGAVNSTADDIEPSVSPDGLTIVFASSREPKNGIFDIWMATRENVNDVWGAPIHLPAGINTDTWQGSPSLIADGFGSTLVFHSGQGARIASRVTVTSLFASSEPLDPEKVLAGVSSPFLSSDGSTLWFRHIDDETGKHDLWYSHRVRE